MSEDVGFLHEDELGITELSHLRKIQARHLSFRGDSLPEEEFEPQVQQEAKGEDETQQSRNPHELCGQLAPAIAPVEYPVTEPVTPFQLPP